MRKLLVTAAFIAAAASPALAQPGYDEDWDDAPRAIDPATVDRAAGTLDRLVGALMDLPVGGIAAAVDPLGRGSVRPHDTLGDLASRDDPYVEARIRSNIRGTARGMEAMSRSVARMMPALRQSLDEIRRDMAIAIDDARDDPDY